MNTDWKPRVVEYYEKTFWDYFLVYFRGDNYSMNYGYWDNAVHSRNASYGRLYAHIADTLAITPGDRVLDAGCGMGEAACFMAKTYGCQVTGVTISPSQLEKANKIIMRRKLGDRVHMVLADYTNMRFPDGSFDKIYAIETICHIEDKTDFYREAYRLLIPGGSLAVAEYIQKKAPESKSDRHAMETFLEGWAIPNIWTQEAHARALNKSGYKDIQIEDYSHATIPVARYLYWYSVLGIPVYRLLRPLGVINELRMKDALSCRYQYLAKHKDLWGHALITARKP